VPEESADIALALDAVYRERKQQAFKVQPSQMASLLEKADPADIRDLTCFECFMRAD